MSRVVERHAGHATFYRASDIHFVLREVGSCRKPVHTPADGKDQGVRTPEQLYSGTASGLPEAGFADLPSFHAL